MSGFYGSLCSPRLGIIAVLMLEYICIHSCRPTGLKICTISDYVDIGSVRVIISKIQMQA